MIIQGCYCLSSSSTTASNHCMPTFHHYNGCIAVSVLTLSGIAVSVLTLSGISLSVLTLSCIAVSVLTLSCIAVSVLTQMVVNGGPELLDELCLATHCPLGTCITTRGYLLPAHSKSIISRQYMNQFELLYLSSYPLLVCGLLPRSTLTHQCFVSPQEFITVCLVASKRTCSNAYGMLWTMAVVRLWPPLPSGWMDFQLKMVRYSLQ